MYQDHFGLHADPFALGPSLKFLFRSHAHAETMAHLGYGLEQGEDIIMISGAIGTGKTLALHNLQAKVSPLFRQVVVNVTRVSFIEFLKLMLHELGETWPPGADAADLLVCVKTSALEVHAGNRKILLVVDEAQNLDVQTLEGVRLLTNIGQPDKQLFQIILAGQPRLDAMVEKPELAQLRQRIRIHYRLDPLTAKETGEYIVHRLGVAGRQDSLFSAGAVRRIHEFSGGIPRLVNHLAAHAMLAAFVEKSRTVDAGHVASEGMPEIPSAGAAIRSDSSPSPKPPLVESVAPPPPRRTLMKDQRPEPRPEPTPEEPETGRSRSWLWVWAFVIVFGAVGAWYLLRDNGAPTIAVGPPIRTPVNPTVAVADTHASPAKVEAIADPEVEVAKTYWIHVASFRDEIRAGRYRDLLSDSGCTVEQRHVTLPDGQDWQRILLGPYSDTAVADSVAVVLERRGLVTSHRLLIE